MCRHSGRWGGNNDPTEAKCPNGWSMFQNWSTTENTHGACYSKKCSTGWHPWANIPREQCNPGGCCGDGQCAWARIVEVGCIKGTLLQLTIMSIFLVFSALFYHVSNEVQ